MSGLYWIVLAVAAAIALDRLALWAESRGWIFWRKRKPKRSAMGAAMLELQDLLEAGRAKPCIELQQGQASESESRDASPPAGGH